MGTLREARRLFGVPNSPRTQAWRTRTRPAVPVDVAPAQPEELALAQAGHSGHEVERPFDGAELVLGYRGDERVELGLVEVVDVLGGLAAWRVDELDGVVPRPALLLAVGEDRMEEAQHVADALG
jgi:hypothetical protein